MTSKEFLFFWTTHYPKTIPLAHYFKHIYTERWFRIHSLPESKRYAETEEEWIILLERHNTLISDLIGANLELLLVTGEISLDGSYPIPECVTNQLFSNFQFTGVSPINLHKWSPEEYNKDTIYIPLVTKLKWTYNNFNALLKAVAEDKMRFFFIEPSKPLIIAPYDGGVDIVLPNEELKNKYKEKYKDWLSFRQDEL